MSGRLDYYFRQLVTEAELDRGFDLLESADRSMVVDQGLTGVVLGLGVGENGVPDLNVQVASGVAYSKDGERINIPATQTVDLSEDDSGSSTAVAGAGNEKWVSIFLVFDRVLSDPRIDGNSTTVFFERAESYTFSIVQGAEASIGTATRPALDADKILLAEVLLTNNQTAIVNVDLDLTRRETRTLPLAAAQYGGGPTWADGTPNPATDVEAQLDKLISDLAQSPDGSNRILSRAIAGVPNSLSQASLFGQFGQLLSALNAHLTSSAAHDADAITNTLDLLDPTSFSGGTDVALADTPPTRAINPQTQTLAYGRLTRSGGGAVSLLGYNMRDPDVVFAGVIENLLVRFRRGISDAVFTISEGASRRALWAIEQSSDTEILILPHNFDGTIMTTVPDDFILNVTVHGQPL